METFFLILLIPIAIALVGRLVFKATITWEEMVIQLIVASLITTFVWFAGSWHHTSDVEILNGQIISKHRDHGSYIRSYQCNCRTTRVGDSSSTTCSTCYETRYTVDWYLKTTVGDIKIDHLDRTSRAVYNAPDPTAYANAYVKEPVARGNRYTNYIKAVPESLFNMKEARSLIQQFQDQIPSYPRIYDYYKVNRVIPVGVRVPNIKEWNKYLSYQLRTIGPNKQANIIIILVNTNNQSYRYALEGAWLGGKKNDVIVIAGVTNYPNIDWVDTITLGQNAGNSLMTVEMRDRLTGLGTIANHEEFIDVVANVVTTRFDRKPMADFEYLKDSVQPPAWLIFIAVLVSILISGGLMYYFHAHQHIVIDWRSFRR